MLLEEFWLAECSWGGSPLFSPFVDNGSYFGSLESQSLKIGIVTLSRLISVTLVHICSCISQVYSIMHCFLTTFSPLQFKTILFM